MKKAYLLAGSSSGTMWLSCPELSEKMHLALADMVGADREGVLAMSVGVGRRVFAE